MKYFLIYFPDIIGGRVTTWTFKQLPFTGGYPRHYSDFVLHVGKRSW